MSTKTKELFIDRVHHRYEDAFRAEDREQMLDAAYTLLYVYAHLGNIPLAERWALECEEHTDNPIELMRIKMVLLAGIMKKGKEGRR